MITQKDAIAEARAYYDNWKAEKYKEHFGTEKMSYNPDQCIAFKNMFGFDPLENLARSLSVLPNYASFGMSFNKFMKQAICNGTEWHCKPTTEAIEFDKRCVKICKLDECLTWEDPREGVYRISVAAANNLQTDYSFTTNSPFITVRSFITAKDSGEIVAITLEEAYARNLREAPYEWAGIGSLSGMVNRVSSHAREALQQVKEDTLKDMAYRG